MSAGHRQYVAPAQHMIRQPGWAGGVGQVAIEQFLDDRPAPAHHVADHHHVRLEFGELVGIVAFPQGDTGLGQLSAHRRIDAGIATGHGMPRRAASRATPAMNVPQIPRM